METFSNLINGKTPVLVDFYAEWCGPCKSMPPILKEVASHFGSALKVIKIDVDKNQQATQTYRIMGVPTLMLFKEGKILWQQAGVVGAADLIRIVEGEMQKV